MAVGAFVDIVEIVQQRSSPLLVVVVVVAVGEEDVTSHPLRGKCPKAPRHLTKMFDPNATD